jgi:Putative transposase of IS4/5 family (DUF4096)
MRRFPKKWKSDSRLKNGNSTLIRAVLTDAQWERIAPLLPGKKGDPGRSSDDNRRSLEGILWIVRTGAPWRDLPDVFGNWFTVWKRFRRWAAVGLLRVKSSKPQSEHNISASPPIAAIIAPSWPASSSGLPAPRGPHHRKPKRLGMTAPIPLEHNVGACLLGL